MEANRYEAGARYYLSSLNLDVAINAMPAIPTMIAIPVVFSPKILPFHIKKAPVNARIIPATN